MNAAAAESITWNPAIESESQWQKRAEELTRRLAELIEPEGLAEPIALTERGGCSCRIRSLATFGGALQTEWSGILRMQTVDGQPQITASLFLFSRGRRLQLAGQLGSSLELIFEPPARGGGGPRWVVLGWQEDLFGEYEDLEL